ncbi:unnamed protein product [Victoria cruziana]
MGFLSGLILGIAFGIGVVVVFVRSENSRSKIRRDLAAAIASLSRMTVEDSRKLLPAPYYPSWVVFSERQKLKWLNQELVKIWPYVSEFIHVLYVSTGVSIIEDGKSGITMELEMQWDGNPSIILDVRTRVGVSLPIQVKDIGFTGVFRLIFRPLVEELPCFGAISYSLRDKKKLDFTLKVVGGEVSSIPGISDAIEGMIRDAIEDSITWPVRKIIPILPGDYSDLELKPVGTLDVKLVQAKDLTNKDLIGKSDPFAVLYIRPLPDKMKKSRVINNDLNPVWNENFEFIVEDAVTQRLVVKIYDDEGIQASELIGCGEVKLKDLEPGKVKDVWLKLVKDLDIQRDNKNRGQVQLELLYCTYGMANGFSNPFADARYSMTSLEKALKSGANVSDTPDAERNTAHRKRDVIIRGVLSVTVISAEDLPAMDLMGKSDPFVVVQMKKTEAKNKTRVVNENLNPVWNQTFDFVVEDGLHDMLILEVYDHDTFKKDYMGRCILTLTKVIMVGEYKDELPLDDAKSGKLHLHLKWTPQPIYRDS